LGGSYSWMKRYPTMALTDTVIKSLRAGVKPDETTTSRAYRVYDAKGLYIEVKPTGTKVWRFKFRFEGKEKLLSLGAYPEVSLKKARERRDAYRTQIADGIDPSDARRAEKLSKAGLESFETVAYEWLSKQTQRWSSRHAERSLTRFKKNVFPWLGSKNINNIKAPELLAVLRRIESRGAIDSAHRTLQQCGQVFRYAVATGRAERDPTGDLKGALSPVVIKHHPSLTEPKQIGELLRAISGFSGQFSTLCALRLAPMLIRTTRRAKTG